MSSIETSRLSELVASFGEAMRRKLWKKMRQGYSGWGDNSDPAVLECLQDKLQEHVKRYLAGDPLQLVDIANLVAMLWNWHGRPEDKVESLAIPR